MKPAAAVPPTTIRIPWGSRKIIADFDEDMTAVTMTARAAMTPKIVEKFMSLPVCRWFLTSELSQFYTHYLHLEIVCCFGVDDSGLKSAQLKHGSELEPYLWRGMKKNFKSQNETDDNENG